MVPPCRRGKRTFPPPKQILFDRGALIIAAFVNELGLYRAGLGGIPQADYNGTGVYRSLRFVGEAG